MGVGLVKSIRRVKVIATLSDSLTVGVQQLQQPEGAIEPIERGIERGIEGPSEGAMRQAA